MGALSRRGEGKSKNEGLREGPSVSRECAHQSGGTLLGRQLPKGNSNSVFYCPVVLFIFS